MRTQKFKYLNQFVGAPKVHTREKFPETWLWTNITSG